MSKANGHKKWRSRIRFIACQAQPGMFRQEYLVYFEGYEPGHLDKRIQVQLFVDECLVKNLSGRPERKQPVNGWLQVSLAAERGGLAEIVLPQPGQPVGERAWVHANELKKMVKA